MAMGFAGIDYYALDELLTEDELFVRKSVREWVERRLMPMITKAWEDGHFPAELVPEMAELGLLGSTLPTEYGCPGIGPVAYGLAMQELERCDSGIRSFASVQGALAMYPIFSFGSEEQRRRWLPPMAKGEVIGCFGLTEADGGSNPAAMRTRATRQGDGYLLNGAKMWITNGSIADLAVVWAKLEQDGRDVIRGFVVEKGMAGFRAPEIKHKLSLRASVTSELVLEDVLVPETSLLPGVSGLRGPFSCLTQARYGIAWGALGAAMSCFEEARDFAVSRQSFGGPIASKQIVQEKLVWMVSEITKCQLLCWRLGRLMAEDKATHQQVSLAKRDAVWMALQAARLGRDILGANGIVADYQAMRHCCNLESVYTYEGTHDIHTLIVGESITGQRAF
jgi:glutaryl-CoA dehydrogenase